MIEKKLFACEKCGKEFERYHDAETHEWECLDKKKLFEENIKWVISKTKQEFGSLIINSTYELEDNCFICEGDFHYSYHFHINIELSNGNTVVIYDGMDQDLWLGNYLEKELIYNSTKREIEKCIPTSFEGIISWKDEECWSNSYIGDLEIRDIVNRLCGRNVRIEVIE